MKGHGQKMSRKKDLAITALLIESTIGGAAKKAGIGESTLLRWLRLPEFQESYKEARREALGVAIASLQRASSDAVSALQEIATDKDAPASSRVSAARSILELALRAVELEDVLLRLERLENESN